MKIQKVTDPAFRKYGQVLEGYDFTGLIKEMKHTPVPEDVIYVPSVEELEALDVMKDLQNKGYGGLPVQIGYCNGHNKKLNAVEYHRNSEINVAVTDMSFLLDISRTLSRIIPMTHPELRHSLYRLEPESRFMLPHFTMHHAM